MTTEVRAGDPRVLAVRRVLRKGVPVYRLGEAIVEELDAVGAFMAPPGWIDPEELVGVAEAAEYLQVSKTDITNAAARDGNFPRPVRELASTRLWLLAELREYFGQE